MAADSCCFVNSFESACVGPPALPLLEVMLEGELDNFPSDGGNELSGVATEPSVFGTGGASAFLQPINSIASKAETRMERVKGISTSYC